MTELNLLADIGIETSVLDVVFVTNQQTMPSAIRSSLDDKDLVWNKVSIDEFSDMVSQADLIGTVVVDTSEMDRSKRQQFCLMIKKLQESNVAAILLNNEIEFPVEDFELVSCIRSASIDELLGRIESNVAYRKRVAGQISDKGSKDGMFDGLAEDTAQQMRMAGQVQRDFLPAELPRLSSVKWDVLFKPADWVSGDIYDVKRLDEQHVGFYIADAVGHSMPAALLTIFVKQAMNMRETTGNDYRIFPPVNVVENLNRHMTNLNLRGCLFATCCYCLLNVKTMQLTCSRAGHPYPIILRNGKEPIQLESKGGLLGVFEEAQFSQETIQLQQGDRVILYSDGLESLVGDVDDDNNFIYTDEFMELSEFDISKIIQRLGRLTDAQKKSPDQIDDVTVVGLEIL
ncbi:MAG: serine/threonine-protein phosphatase [Anaerohalosphaera sp.]|nr:serine/threonine-protein phosphatase [Anaerohalosphaera sp.]